MTDDDQTPSAGDSGASRTSGRRRATITTSHADAETARRVAAAVGPDNTAEMTTRVEDDRVVTTVTRDSTGGLRSTVDDYVVNATVAAQLTTEHDSDTHATHATHNDNDTS
jgi:hypothetical protein